MLELAVFDTTGQKQNILSCLTASVTPKMYKKHINKWRREAQLAKFQVLHGEKAPNCPESHLKHLFKTLASLANQRRSAISGTLRFFTNDTTRMNRRLQTSAHGTQVTYKTSSFCRSPAVNGRTAATSGQKLYCNIVNLVLLN